MSEMPDRTQLEAILSKALSSSQAQQTEALISASAESLTRYTHNYIHESVSERNCHLNVRAVIGKRTGVASTNKLDDAGIADVVKRACDIARLSTEDKDFPGLPGPAGDVTDLPDAFDADTATAPPEVRAAAVSDITKVMRLHNLYGAGYVSTQHDSLAIANSLGVKRFFEWSDSAMIPCCPYSR